jgi:hypothetical protein
LSHIHPFGSGNVDIVVAPHYQPGEGSSACDFVEKISDEAGAVSVYRIVSCRMESSMSRGFEDEVASSSSLD